MSAEDGAARDQATSTYEAVIYFHGMGSQRRFEELSRLIDCIDSYLSNSYRRGDPQGLLTQIRPRIEPGRDDPSKTFTHVRTIFRASTKDDWSLARTVRFYEVYWAPIMAGQKSPWRVLKWMFAQVVRPWRTLRSPWRERQRLRRAALVALFERGAQRPQGVEERDFHRLIARYDAFEGPEAIHDYPKGRFADFLAFLAEEGTSRPETAKRHERLARAWLSAYRRTELRNAFALVSLALAMLLFGGGAVMLILILLQRFTDIAAGTSLATLAAQAPATWASAIGVVVGLSSFFGLGKFLVDYMGDVEAWATYEETDEKHERREKVLDRGLQTLAEVLGNQRCTRATIVSHSLGTTIAHDTLLAAARLNRATNAEDPIEGLIPLNKIEHFITMASPIDKIEYFFESYRSASHRYKRVVEELRGDIGDVPFTRNRHPYIHWVNFWDDGDVISGPLYSPANRSGFSQRVDNVHVASLAFPNPAASHSAYFNNRDVIAALFKMIYLRACSFRTLPVIEGKGRDWESAYLGPAIDPPGRRRQWMIVAAALPWLALAALAVYLLCPDWGLYVLAPAAAAALTLAAGLMVSIGRGAVRPL